MTIEDYIQQRNEIQLMAEADQRTAHIFWTELGVANRHIERVVDGQLPLAVVEKEIVGCLERVKRFHGGVGREV